MSLPIEALDRQRRKETLRRSGWSSLVLAAGIILAYAAAASTQEPNSAPDPRVAPLQAEVDRKDRELTQLRQRFTYCRVSLNWGDSECSAFVEQDSTTVTDRGSPVTRVIESDSDDDDDVDSTTVVVREPASRQPTATPPRPTPTENPLTDLVEDTTEELSETVENLTDGLSEVATQ